MITELSLAQLHALETTERVASCFSVIGTMFIILTFTFSTSFRKPINRLIFYASWGNALCNVATLMSQSGIRAGQDSHLCQFQGFLIQMCLPADALWNLAMAINVYLTLFKKYNAQQLKALEWRYHIMCYAIPFIVALVYLFVDTSSRGRIYGDASLWCWISIKWVILRIALCYIPAWIAILVSFTLYAMSGREIFLKRQQLRAFHSSSPNPVANPFTSFKTTEVEITSELADLPSRNHDQYSIKISSSAMSPTFSDAPTVVPPTPTTTNAVQCRNNRAAMEANTAAWGYTKVALLFFVSLLITWVTPPYICCNGVICTPRSVNCPKELRLTGPVLGAILDESRLFLDLPRLRQHTIHVRFRSCSSTHGVLELGHLRYNFLERL
ncbi:MAG: hypothetical protein Q9224_005618 [Gallowayella concinna]